MDVTERSNQAKTAESEKVLVDQSHAELDGSDTSSDDTPITSPFDPSKIRVETKNTQMDALIKRIRNNEIDLSPDFQRLAGIWSDTVQSRLIESMLIKIPLPAFYMDATDDNRWLVVDGLQRLTTIRRFVVQEELSLTGMEFLTEYNGKKYSELPRGLKRRIEETDIVIYQIQPGTPDRVKFDIFRRINTGGAPLSSQEIRHALNQGKVTKFLQEVASSRDFLAATDYGVSPKRMDDRECVLRFLAFSMFPPDGYKEDNFDQFLNQVMARANKTEDGELQQYRHRFQKAMKAAIDIFGNDAFRKRYQERGGRYPINKALFEAWSVNLGNLSEDQLKKLTGRKGELKDKFLNLMNNNEDFEAAISQGTGSLKRVKQRFAEIRAIIEEELSC